MKENSVSSAFFEFPEERANITVAGVGGMGCNFVENLAKTGIKGLDIFAVNTDRQALETCTGARPVQIGKNLTKGRGAGGDPEIGRQSAEDDREMLAEIFKGAEIVFVVAGMGGGTGTGAAPVVAQIAREMNITVVGILTTPLQLEGKKRALRADLGVKAMEEVVDSLVIIANEKINSEVMDETDIALLEVFRRADDFLLRGVRGVSQIITSRGYINLDLADAKYVLKTAGHDSCRKALIGLGEAAGEDRAVKAAMAAIENPLMTGMSIDGAQSLLVNVAGSANMGYKEAQQAIKTIADQAGRDEQEIFIGIVVDDAMQEKMSVTVIATGMANGKNADLVLQTPRQLELYGEELVADSHASLPPTLDDSLWRGWPGRKQAFGRFENWRQEWQVPAFKRRDLGRYQNPEPVRQAEVSQKPVSTPRLTPIMRPDVGTIGRIPIHV